jgi:hypothetical protein
VEGKLPRPPGLSGRHPCSTARHHHHPCSISDVKHMLRRLHRTRAHMSHPSSITSTIHEDGHRIAAEATARARSLPPLADLATRPPFAAGTPCGGRREGRRGEQPRPLGLPGCPSRAFALRIAVAAKRGHRATIAAGGGEEWGGGGNRGHPAFQAAPTCSTTRLRLHRPTPPNPAACAARTGRLAPPSDRIWPPTPRGGGKEEVAEADGPPKRSTNCRAAFVARSSRLWPNARRIRPTPPICCRPASIASPTLDSPPDAATPHEGKESPTATLIACPLG